MYWLLLSLISACMSAAWSLSVDSGLRHVAPTSYAAWYSTGAAILVALGLKYKKIALGVDKWGVLGGVFSGAASVLMAHSFAAASNPGLSMGIFRMQSVATAILSYFIFKAPLNKTTLIGMLVACVGAIVLSLPSRSSEATEHGKEGMSHGHVHEKEHEQEKKKGAKTSSNKWLVLALCAGLAMSVKDLATKKALQVGGKAALGPVLLSTGATQALVALVAAGLSDGNISLKKRPGQHDVIGYVALSSLAFAMYQATVIGASAAAPNVGVVKALDTVGVLLTTFGAHELFGSPVTVRDTEGIVLILVGVVVMCLGDLRGSTWQMVGKRVRDYLCSKHNICAPGAADRMVDSLMGWSAV